MKVMNPFYYIVVKENISDVYRFMSINCKTATDVKEFALSYPTAEQAYKRVAMFQHIQPEKLFGVLRLLEEEEIGEI